jgi:hypothetical protein
VLCLSDIYWYLRIHKSTERNTLKPSMLLRRQKQNVHTWFHECRPNIGFTTPNFVNKRIDWTVGVSLHNTRNRPQYKREKISIRLYVWRWHIRRNRAEKHVLYTKENSNLNINKSRITHTCTFSPSDLFVIIKPMLFKS